jgi:hypothetical protein
MYFKDHQNRLRMAKQSAMPVTATKAMTTCSTSASSHRLWVFGRTYANASDIRIWLEAAGPESTDRRRAIWEDLGQLA